KCKHWSTRESRVIVYIFIKMGKKTKTGKHRRDVFYRKAKEAGYRARAAYKLIQLNSKYEFLQKSKVCIDLCAAPGSWMQVATKYMPVSSIIVGIDLVPIKPIHNCIAVQGDITTEKVRQELRGTLKTWKADLVLHDGAPNVGQNWIHDAYQQNLLVLHSFKLACEFLQKGGTFVTKVFRSKDYFNLEYVFRKLFKKVEATKPQASRYESAEIFVVCSHYLAPAKIDPQFFDAKSVFQELDPEPQNKLNIIQPTKDKKKREGYAEGATILFNSVPVSEFINSANFVSVLQDANEFNFDDDNIRNHKSTTNEVVECCKDIRVLGRRELRLLLTWRKNLKADIDAKAKKAKSLDADTASKEVLPTKTEEEIEDEELDEVQKEINKLKEDEARSDRQARRKVAKSTKKLEERLRLKAVIPGDIGPTEAQSKGLFSLDTLSQVSTLKNVVDQSADVVMDTDDEDGDSGDENDGRRKYVAYERDTGRLSKSGQYYKATGEADSDADSDGEDDEDVEGLGFKKSTEKLEDPTEDDDMEEGEKRNPLLTDLVGDKKEAKKARKAELWFSKDIFKDAETEADEDMGLELAMQNHVLKGGKIKQKKGIIQEDNNNAVPDEEKAKDAPDTDSEESDSDSDTDSETENTPIGPQMIGSAIGPGAGGAALRPSKKRGLDPVGLSLATQMIHSKKAKRDITDAAWNRYMFGGLDDLPKWFTEDERKHNMPQIEVDREDLKMYRERSKDVNVRSIKKVVEAKARKARRVKKRVEKTRKKAENITENADMSEREKALEVKRLYAKAMAPMTKKKETKYVVMKKSGGGAKPKGQKGPYKMVDKRMKKEVKAKKRSEKSAKGKGSKGRGKKR
ncbi:unnamed protein product, partial [Meganyctiphanes norvegica]